MIDELKDIFKLFAKSAVGIFLLLIISFFASAICVACFSALLAFSGVVFA